MALGIATSGLLLDDGVSPWLGLVTWGLTGFGMGLAYTAISLAILELSPRGAEGSSAAAMQLGSVIGIAVGTGVAGAVVAALAHDAPALRGAIAAAGGVMLLVAGLAVATARRLGC
jgi:MFS family permease